MVVETEQLELGKVRLRVDLLVEATDGDGMAEVARLWSAGESAR